MSRFSRFSWRATCAFVLAAAAATACGRGEPGPTAQPEVVVDAAPDATMASGSATVHSTGPYVAATGTVSFARGADTMTIAGRNTTSVPWGVQEPLAALDLLRGVVDVSSYGGAEVQGIGTKRYQVDLNLEKALEATPEARRADLELLTGMLGDDGEVWGDVFVDSTGAVRRILLPVQTATERPRGDSKKIPQLVSVDFFDFGKEGQ